MLIMQTLEKIASDICDKYCKYPDIYATEYGDNDEAFEKMCDERCEQCPLMLL